jgi:hypothetical protein
MSAYEELKAWCEKHLAPEDYKIVPESKSYFASIYFAEDIMNENDGGVIVFNSNGEVIGLRAIDYYCMMEHIEEYERTEEAPKPDLIPTSIGGQMVRKMIEAYERNMNK